MDKIEYLTLCGGGVKGIAYAGCLKALDEHNIMKNIKGIIGTSAGAIVAVLFAVGYNYDEVEKILNETNFNSFKDSPWSIFGDAYRLKNYYGVYLGDNFENWFRKLFKLKTGKDDMTFKEFYEKYNIDLVLTGTCINKRLTYYYNYNDYPDMSVISAVRISMCYPIFFLPVKIGDDYMVDGATLNNYPINYFKEKYPKKSLSNNINNKDIENIDNKDSENKDDNDFYKNIGFKFMATGEEPKHQIYYGDDKINGLPDFVGCILNSMQTQIERSYLNDDDWKCTIPIDTKNISPMKFDLSNEDKKFLIESGYKSTRLFLESITKKTL